LVSSAAAIDGAARADVSAEVPMFSARADEATTDSISCEKKLCEVFGVISDHLCIVDQGSTFYYCAQVLDVGILHRKE